MSNDTKHRAHQNYVDFKCYGCGKVFEKANQMAMECLCGGNEGVCLKCFERTLGEWELLDHKPENYKDHSLMPTSLNPDLKRLRDQTIENNLHAALRIVEDSKRKNNVMLSVDALCIICLVACLSYLWFFS